MIIITIIIIIKSFIHIEIGVKRLERLKLFYFFIFNPQMNSTINSFIFIKPKPNPYKIDYRLILYIKPSP